MTQTAASPYPAARGEQRKGEQRKPVIKATDMSEDMQQDAIETAAAVSMTAPPAPRLPASAPLGGRRVNSTRAPASPLRPTGRALPPERTPSRPACLPCCALPAGPGQVLAGRGRGGVHQNMRALF
jgi:hypothetical protein